MGIHPHILHNGRIRDAACPELRAGQIGLLAGWGVFTTLKIAGGVPFAWERHWARLSRDAALLHVPMPADASGIEEDLLELIEANGHPECTLRLAIVRNGGGMWEDSRSRDNSIDVLAMTADSRQWHPRARLGVQENARFAGNEFAGAKVLSWAHNLTWAERAQRAGLDETILLNQYGSVAECTSANIFAAFGGEVFTPPLSDGCLPGITREVLLDALRIPGIVVTERRLTIEDLYRADEVFLTSTTRDLLSVGEIAGRPLRPAGPVRESLAAEFEKFTFADLARRRNAGARV